MLKNTANAIKPSSRSLPRSLSNVKSKQKGVVLIVSLVFLVALTAVASVLMLNTSSDMKMSGASQEKVTATQEAISSIDQIIFTQIEGPTNAFGASVFPISMDAVVTSANTTADINMANANNLVVDCPSSNMAWGVEQANCNLLRLRVTKLYGRSETSNVQVNAGIAKLLINTGG